MMGALFQAPDASTVERYIDRFGFPVAILTALILALWSIGRRVGPIVSSFVVGLQTQAATSLTQVVEVYKERLNTAEERLRAAEERSKASEERQRVSQEQFLITLKEQGERHQAQFQLQADNFRTLMQAQADHFKALLEVQATKINESLSVQTQAIRDLSLQIRK